MVSSSNSFPPPCSNKKRCLKNKTQATECIMYQLHCEQKHHKLLFNIKVMTYDLLCKSMYLLIFLVVFQMYCVGLKVSTQKLYFYVHTYYNESIHSDIYMNLNVKIIIFCMKDSIVSAY